MATLRSVPVGVLTKAPQYGPEQELRASAVLTLLPVVSTDDLDAESADEVELVLDFTLGTSTGCRIRIFASDTDGAAFVQQTVFDPSTGDLSQLEVIISETGVKSFRFAPGRRYVRVSAYATGAVAGTLLSITARGIHAARRY